MNQVAWVEESRTQLRHLRNPSMQPETVCSGVRRRSLLRKQAAGQKDRAEQNVNAVVGRPEH